MRRDRKTGRRRRGSVAVMAAALLLSPVLAERAEAFSLFGIKLWGSDDDTAEVINPVNYKPTIETGNADKDLKSRLSDASALMSDAKQPVSGDLGVVIKAREDRERLVAILYEEARYGGVVHISVAGTDIDSLPPTPTFSHSTPVPVDIRIDPGPKFTVGKIRLEGDLARFDAGKYDLVPGGEAGSRVILKASETMINDLKKEGRPLAKLGQRQVVADHRTDTVDITISATGGPVAPFGEVTVKGARAVDPAFIKRYSRLDQHQQYSPEQLKKASDRMRQLGVFSSINIKESDALAPDGSLPLAIEVSEGKFRYFGIGADYSSLDGAGLKGYWGHRNLFGQAESLRIEGSVSGIDSADPTDFDYSAGITFTKPGIYVPQATFETSLIAKSESPDTYQAQSITYSAGIAYELNETDKLKAGGEIAYIRADDAFGTNDYLTFSLPVSFDRDTRDNKLDPTKGYHATFSVKPSYEAMRGTIFSSFEGSLSGYKGLGAEDKVVLAAQIAAGSVIGGSELSDIPVTRRFFAGGGGSVRGYSYREISPYNDENEALGGRSYALASFEVRVKMSENFGIVPFLDVGSVSTEITPDFSDIRAGAGIGIRYATPFGPLRLDVAVPLQKYDGGTSFGIYAGIGQAF